MNDDQKRSLEDLLDGYFGEELDDAGHLQLSEVLQNSPEARALFWERSQLESQLENWGQRQHGEVIAFPQTPRNQSNRWRPWLTASGWAAAVAMGIGFWANQSAPKEQSVAKTESNEPKSEENSTSTNPRSGNNHAVAYLSQLVDLESEEDFLAGQLLEVGREVVISKGLMELVFFSGAQITIEGPARFTPTSDMEIAFAEGGAQAVVPESAIGFKMVLPDGLVTDYGTSFDVRVIDGKTERIQVIEGEIEVSSEVRKDEARRLLIGDAISIEDTGSLANTEYKPVGFTESIEVLAKRSARARQAAWLEYCRKLDQDESLAVHLSFLPQESGQKVIKNHSQTATAPQSASVISAKWSEGRWPGKPALSFHRPSDRVRIEIPGEFPQATLAAWVRVDGLPRKYNGLFFSEYFSEGETHWQLSSAGEYMFGIRPKDSPPISKFHRAFSGPVLSPWAFGSWRFLATSFDSTTREVVHYVDGREVGRITMEEAIPLRFGRATLGNFHDPYYSNHDESPGLTEEWSFRNWTGAIDEFLLFSRALGSDEIAEIFEAGKVN
ncbi:LamG domain-containing protein [Roseibacillus persicicus]|uniref:FecR protein domain-containing protein n=1 Tax=Roseibacillus persicicus TaxID=454148 RepID=A0A918WH08_9BACT|nr:LamG domain-containing protein [Roseibacillus persicicus]GHC45838.1 hypothetical protein GCM10007100_09120 [Roseibacillus persicicus]